MCAAQSRRLAPSLDAVRRYLGAKIGILGANGAGKSTLLRNLAAKRLDGLPDTLKVRKTKAGKWEGRQEGRQGGRKEGMVSQRRAGK